MRLIKAANTMALAAGSRIYGSEARSAMSSYSEMGNEMKYKHLGEGGDEEKKKKGRYEPMVRLNLLSHTS